MSNSLHRKKESLTYLQQHAGQYIFCVNYPFDTSLWKNVHSWKKTFKIIRGLWLNKLQQSVKYDPFKSSKQIWSLICVFRSCVKSIHSNISELVYPRLCVQCKCEHAIRKCSWTCQNVSKNSTLTFKRLKYVYRVPNLKTQLWLSFGVIVIDS